MVQALPTGITGKIIGNGIYLSSSSSFNVEIVEDDLDASMGTSVNDVTLLPKQCKHGYIVKIATLEYQKKTITTYDSMVKRSGWYRFMGRMCQARYNKDI